MPVATKSEAPPLIPPGKHILTLKSVDEVESDNFTGDGKTLQWLWKFISNQMDEDGTNYELRWYTGPNYGSANAKLTELLDMMMPDADPDDRACVDTDTLCKKKYSAQIMHKPKQKGEGMKAVIKFIAPFTKNAKGEETENAFAEE